MKNKQCAKQRVFAMVITDAGPVFGENICNNPQEECPRKGMKTGEGYSLCKSICKQEGHAETNLIKNIGGDLGGRNVYVIGHYYACEKCMEAIRHANGGDVIIVG